MIRRRSTTDRPIQCSRLLPRGILFRQWPQFHILSGNGQTMGMVSEMYLHPRASLTVT